MKTIWNKWTGIARRTGCFFFLISPDLSVLKVSIISLYIINKGKKKDKKNCASQLDRKHE